MLHSAQKGEDMYSFEPSEEQQMLVDAVGKYAQNDLRPAAMRQRRAANYRGSLSTRLGAWPAPGIHSRILRWIWESFRSHRALALEEMAFGDLAGSLAVMTPSLFATPILLAGSEEQKQEYLPKIAGGDWPQYTAALIEYSYDFDANDLRATARADGGGYILNGEKAFVPFARDAEAMLIYAKLDGRTQVSSSQKYDGLTVADEREKLMGINALPLYRVKLNDVTIPATNRLGGRQAMTLN